MQFVVPIQMEVGNMEVEIRTPESGVLLGNRLRICHGSHDPITKQHNNQLIGECLRFKLELLLIIFEKKSNAGCINITVGPLMICGPRVRDP